MALYFAFPEMQLQEECDCNMRKTVYEWLETNQNGMGLAKKKAARRRSFKRRATSGAHFGQTFKKRQIFGNKFVRRPLFNTGVQRYQFIEAIDVAMSGPGD